MYSLMELAVVPWFIFYGIVVGTFISHCVDLNKEEKRLSENLYAIGVLCTFIFVIFGIYITKNGADKSSIYIIAVPMGIITSYIFYKMNLVKKFTDKFGKGKK